MLKRRHQEKYIILNGCANRTKSNGSDKEVDHIGDTERNRQREKRKNKEREEEREREGCWW